VELLHLGLSDLHGSTSPRQVMVEEFLLTGHQYSLSSRRKGKPSDSTECLLFLGGAFTECLE
jgi:hypothetical protein